MIRKANSSDVEKIIELHLNSFSESHFSIYFSRKMLIEYFSILLEKNIFSYVYYVDENKLLGYVIAGFETHRAVEEFITNNRIKLLFLLLKKPKFLIEKIIELTERKTAKYSDQISKCRLYLIAIDSANKGKGIGKGLLQFLENELIMMNISFYGLSVRKNNKQAILFYENNGYEIEYENTKSIYYKKKLAV